MAAKKVVVLGASGSIGKSALDIIKHFKDRFTLTGFSVHLILEFAKKYRPNSPVQSFIPPKPPKRF